MTDESTGSSGRVIHLKPLELEGVILETRTVKVIFPFSDTIHSIELVGGPFGDLVEAIAFARGKGLIEMALRTLPRREGGVFPLLDSKADLRSSYLISSVGSIQGEAPLTGNTYWIIEKADTSTQDYLGRTILS